MLMVWVVTGTDTCCQRDRGMIEIKSQGRTERLFLYILSKEASNKVSECTEILVVLWQSTLVLTKNNIFHVFGEHSTMWQTATATKNVFSLDSFVITSNLLCAKPIVCHFYDKFFSLTTAIDWGLACQYELEPISNFWVEQVLLIIKLTSDCVWPTLQQWLLGKHLYIIRTKVPDYIHLVDCQSSLSL